MQIKGTAIEGAKHHNMLAVNQMRNDVISGTDTSAVFHHRAPDEREASYKEMACALKFGGRCYVFEHNPYNSVTR
jgi:hypothetical protein